MLIGASHSSHTGAVPLPKRGMCFLDILVSVRDSVLGSSGLETCGIVIEFAPSSYQRFLFQFFFFSTDFLEPFVKSGPWLKIRLKKLKRNHCLYQLLLRCQVLGASLKLLTSVSINMGRRRPGLVAVLMPASFSSVAFTLQG
jgi:hypothetical protein